MKLIILTQGYSTVVDDEDYEELSKYKWTYNHNYAVRGIKNNSTKSKRTLISMHRTILQPSNDLDVDHINGNGLDNRRSNLRVCTHLENMGNTKLIANNNTSGYKGVVWDKTRNKWRAQIKIRYTNKFLGRFIYKTEAALAYNEAATKYFGEYAKLNMI